MFAHQIGRNVQVYVDDMLVKGIREDDHLNDLQETFSTLRSYNMKLNPNKCVFVRGDGRKVSGFHSIPKGYWGQFGKNTSHTGVSSAKDGQRGIEPERKDSYIEQIHLKSNR